jgi:hypothetical protein
MPTKLEKTVKREIEIDGQPFTVAISPAGLKITQKGFRKGQEVSWRELWASGSSDETTGAGADESSSRSGMSPGTFGGSAESGFR